MLWRRFRMPTEHGSKDAVAVEVEVGNQLISAYTFMLEHIVLLAWSITVLVGLLISIQKYAHDHPSRPLSKDIWRKRASPFDILKLAFRHLRKEKSARWLIVPWLAIAVAFVVVKYAVPSKYFSFWHKEYLKDWTSKILKSCSAHSFFLLGTADSKAFTVIFAPYIQIGSAAPVRPEAIFVPSRNGTGGDLTDQASDLLNIEVFELVIPSALRAAGSVDSVMTNKKKNTSVSISQPETLQTLINGDLIMQFGYQYNVTGLDLGLQNHPDLTLSVEGSCVTDYSWWSFSAIDNPAYPGAYIDVYNVFNDPGNQQAVSKYDGGPTSAYFFANPPPTDTPTNATWGAVVSSVNRSSYWPSTDPWYRTGPNPLLADNPQSGLAPWMVMPQRPALSCWQNDAWSYRGHTSDISHLDAIPGLELPLGIRTILVDNLGVPMIFALGSYLHASSLKSSSTAISDLFDANSSSIFQDLQRLIFASYIATVNTMTETTLYPPGIDILNDVTYNGALLDGTAEFVIFSNEVVTLSVRSLIIIPTLAVTLWLAFVILMFLPIPGKLVAGLSPTRKGRIDLEKQEADRAEPEISRKPDIPEAGHSPQVSTPEPVSYKPVVSESPKPAISMPEKAQPKKEEPSQVEKAFDQVSDTVQQVLSSDSDSEIDSITNA